METVAVTDLAAFFPPLDPLNTLTLKPRSSFFFLNLRVSVFCLNFQSHFQRLPCRRRNETQCVGVRAGETTVRPGGRSNPLRLSLSAFLYLYSKCQCINGFRRAACVCACVCGVIAKEKEESKGCEEQQRNGAGTTGCLCALGEPCKQHGEGRGIYREK